MLSKAAFRSAQQLKPVTAIIARPVHATTVRQAEERDEVNFPRPVRPIYPGKVRIGFIPDEWFTMFYNKTGVTGPYMFGIGLITFLCSKEYYVMEHEFYTGITLVIMGAYVMKKFGPPLAEYLDKEIDVFEKGLEKGREHEKTSNKIAIEDEKKAQIMAQGANPLLFAAKKENVGLQLEAVYRERLALAHSEVKKRLDYQLETANVKTRLEQKHMVNWIVGNVKASITPAQESAALKKCIADLKGLAV